MSSSRKPCCVGDGVKKGTWTSEEDNILISYIHQHGEGNWRDIPQKAGLKRCGKSCRLRWVNYLKPDIKRGEFSYEEDQIIIMLHASRGNKWSVIAAHLPKRTDNEIKNYWNTHLKKRLVDQGIDPVTHKPLSSKPSLAADEQSQSGSMSSKSLKSSRSSNVPKISRSDGSLRSKKRCFKRSSSTSKLLNKVATKAASIRNILSASMEGTYGSSTTLPPCLNDDFSDTSQFQMEDMISMNFEYDVSQFLEQFNNNEDEETDKNINGGYNQDLLISDDVSSTNVDEDSMMEDINGWSNFMV